MRRLGIAVMLCAVGWWSTSSLQAAVSPEQQKKADSIDDLLKQATDLVKAKNFTEAGPLVIQAQNALTELAGEGPAVKVLVGKLHAKLATLHRVVGKNGVELPPLEDPAEKPKPGKPGATAAGGISFTKQVVPLLVGRCRGCHIDGTRGGLNFSTYANLMKGSTNGVIFTPNASKGSRLMDVLESGDMPRGGNPFNADELALVAKWIDQGAKFDGTDPNAMIAAGAAAPMPRPMLPVTQASGNEATKFSRDVAPVIAAQCTGCHGGRQPAAQMTLETFTGILAGSRQDGAVISPGNADASLIIKKIKGTAGARMPLNQPPLSDETIALFEKWVAEGAKFDGSDPNETTEMVANVYKATQMTHEELAAYRANLALKNWQLSNPDQAPEQHQTDNFLLFGNVGQDRLVEIGTIAEAQVTKVARLFKAPAGQPMLKGKMTLFVFNKRYDYSEFGQMVEKREVPDQWHGHWKYNVVDAYGCVLPSEAGNGSIASLVAQQLAGAYLQSVARVPQWFAQGSSWAMGARIDAKDPLIKQWNESVPAILAQSKKPDDFLTGALPPGEIAVANYSFADYLMSNQGKYSALLTALRRGAPFDQALQQVYGGTANQLALGWAGKVLTKRSL